jgi:hypothetical protein
MNHTFEKVSQLILFVLVINLCISCENTESEEWADVPEEILSIENLTLVSSDPEPAGSIILEREVSFGDTDDVILSSLIIQADADDSGRVYIADGQLNTVHVFHPDGSYFYSIGQEGDGPGEFRRIQAMEISEHYLHILDIGHSRISTYDLNTFEHTGDFDVSLNETGADQPLWMNRTQDERLFYRPIRFFVNPDGNYLVLFGDQTVGAMDNLEGRTWEVSMFSPPEGRYLEHDVVYFQADMNAFTFDDGTRISRVPFKPEAHIDSNGEWMVYGWGDDLLIKLFDTRGNFHRAFYYSRQNVEVKLDEVTSYYEMDLAGNEGLRDHIIRRLRNSELPQQWPAFHHLKIDDENRIWIARIKDDHRIYEWWVLKDTGQLISRFEMPRNEPIEVIKNGYMYTRETDEMDIVSIVRYRFDMENP